MVREVFATPASSASSERVFSVGTQVKLILFDCKFSYQPIIGLFCEEKSAGSKESYWVNVDKLKWGGSEQLQVKKEHC